MPSATPARKIRVGIVGVGNWALKAQLPVLTALPDYEIVAVYSQRPAAALKAAADFNIPHGFNTVEELVNHPEVDLVLILTTAPQHEVGLRAAISAGKDVYCEWPLTPDPALSAELLKLAQDANIKTIIGLQRGFAPALQYARDLIKDGYVGTVRSVDMRVSVPRFGATRPNAMRWSIPENTFLSVISIFGGHFLNPLFSIVGPPAELSAVAVNQYPVVTVEETGEQIPTTAKDQLVLSGTLRSGAVLSVHIEGGKRFHSGVLIDITGDGGDLRITNTSAFGGVNEGYQVSGGQACDEAAQALPLPESYVQFPEDGLATGIAEVGDLFIAYAADLANGSTTAPTFADAVWLQNLFTQFIESQETGRRVTVPELAH